MTGKISLSINMNKKACCHLVNMRRQPRNKTNRREKVGNTAEKLSQTLLIIFPKVGAGLRY